MNAVQSGSVWMYEATETSKAQDYAKSPFCWSVAKTSEQSVASWAPDN